MFCYDFQAKIWGPGDEIKNNRQMSQYFTMETETATLCNIPILARNWHNLSHTIVILVQ